MITFKEIVKSYNGVGAVDHLNLVVNEGELCVLLGESGCGKSTTLNMVNKLIEPDSGAITIGGKDIGAFRVDELRRGIGYVVQSISLFPHMTVAQNIAVVPGLLGWDKQRIQARTKELIDMVGLDVDKYIGKYPAQLSGGEAQRIGVARALAADPKIVLMDEPFGAVDPLNRTNLQNQFLKLQQQLGITVIFVTHDIGEAMKMGDRIALMSKGVLQCYGTPRELLSNKENAFVRSFLGNDSFINILNRYRVEQFLESGRNSVGLPAVEAASTLKDALAAMIEDSADGVRVVSQGDVRGAVTIDAIVNILREGEEKAS